ncbi:MAG: PHP domain-containing protein [Anaerolineae bacterium]
MGSGWVDLHTHTTASDGVHPPAKLVQLAREARLQVLGVTDHDSTAGLAEAAAEAEKGSLEVVPGVEINTDLPRGEAHILGYFIRPEDSTLQARLAELRDGRIRRATAMVDRLSDLGVPVAWESIEALAEGGVVGRPHVAQALAAAGHVRDKDEAFDRYIRRDGPAYVSRDGLAAEEAIALIVDAGGVAALAHPRIFSPEGKQVVALDLETLLPHLVDAGLGGLECYYTRYPRETIEELLTVADRFGLTPVGGSDFHGGSGWHATLGEVEVPVAVFEGLRAKAEA